MGLFEIIFGSRPKTRGQESVFKMLDGYKPSFKSWNGELYEEDQVRAAIHARATHISKLRIEIEGAAHPSLQNKLKHRPNRFQTWSQFLYRLSTLLDIYNTAFICPVYDEDGEVSEIYAPLPRKCEVVQYSGTPYLRYEFQWHEKAAIELSACGIMTKFQHRSDFFGESNQALFPTMDLLNIQRQGIEEGVKSAATYRFMATLTNFIKPEDLKKERERFSAENFGKEAGAGGILLFPNTYKDIRQVDTKPWVIDADQKKLIDANINKYFGVNEDILTNKAFGDAWSAFYEGAIEPWAIQFSEVTTNMLFSLREQTQGNLVMATANRLQYMSNADKLKVSAMLLDRGIMSINDVRDIWNLPPVEEGDERIIRGEYYNVNEKIGGDSNV